MKWLDKLPWMIVIVSVLTIGLAPYAPEPHIVEKLKLLVAGNLVKPIDMFDFLMHGAPWVLLILKTIRQFAAKV